MLLRDSAAKEEDPKKIYDYSMSLDPIRCYQYIPEEVRGLKMLPLPNTHHITAEMLVDDGWTMAASLIWNILYGLVHWKENIICWIKEFYIFIYRRQNVYRQFEKYDCLDSSSGNLSCNDWNYRSDYFIPNVISSAALGMLFLCVMNPQFGFINSLITKLTGEGFVQNWFIIIQHIL